jgi:hypothetical protein
VLGGTFFEAVGLKWENAAWFRIKLFDNLAAERGCIFLVGLASAKTAEKIGNSSIPENESLLGSFRRR